MLSTVTEFIFSKPAGRSNAVVMFSGAAVFAGSYVYFSWVGYSPLFYGLVIAGSLMLVGIAESLPKERGRAAGVLRTTALLALLLMIAILVVAPEIINPR